MKTTKIFLILALLCAIVQGAWAQVEIPDPTHFDDTWDGTTKTKPVYDVGRGYVIINRASELAYIREHWEDDSGDGVDKDYWEHNYLLNANIDMGDAVSWIPLDRDQFRGFQGEFHGENHTIRIHIWGTDDNGQGFISDNCGIVQDLHLTGKIEVGNSRTVGAIAATNSGHIKNCWVSADVSSTHYSGLNNARLGGIVGFNSSTQDDAEVGKIEYCCMTGNVSNSGNNTGVGGILGVQDQCNGIISHIMFYGTRINDNSQDNLWVGTLSAKATFENYHSTNDLGDDDALNNYLSSFSGNDLYRYALKHPHAVNVTTVGQGSVTVSAGGENNILGARPHQEVTLTTSSGVNAEVTATDADGNNVTLFGNSGASGYTFIMQNRPVNVHVVFTVPDWPRQGRGTADDPYLITSADDWNEFALSVSAGTTHSGQYVKLTKDISIWMMAGASKDCSFQGTLDGDGHTLTLNYNATNAVAAPFRYTKNATIKNLRTTGTITTEAMNAAGIVGDVTGSVNLTNCSSSVTISSSRSDADYHGGLVASNNGSVTISGCVFDGSFVATVAHVNSYGTTFCGGLVGYCGENTSTTIINSLVAPTSVSEGMVSNTFVGYGEATITNSYFVATTNLPTNQGQQAHTISAGVDVTISNLGEAVTTYGFNGITVYSKGIKYGGIFFVVSGETVSLTLNHGNKAGYTFSQYAASAGTLSAQTETSATLTMPDADVTINAEWTHFTFAGTGTTDNPYIIGTTDQWAEFATAVNSGYTFSGEHLQLSNNISVSTMVGTGDANSFQGTFDGNGQTLTFTKGTAESPFAEQYCAPFRHVKNATIRNLHVAGTIYTSVQKAAGFVGESHGSLSIMGSRSSINIHSSKSGDGTHGGFVATLSGSGNTINFDGCVFDGSFATTAGTTNCGGFVGWGVYNKPTISNSLMKPSSVDAGMLINTFARWYTGDEGIYEPTIDNCYYVATDNLTTNQGKQAYALASAPANIGEAGTNYGFITAYANGLLYSGKYYVAPGSISLADNATNDVDAINGYFANVTLADRTLYKDGAWNTLCLPFDVTLSGSPLAEATARPLESASVSGSTLNLSFGTAVDELVAGTPYIIKWASGDNIVNPVFSGVTIDATDRSYDNGQSGDLRVRFLGTYKSTSFDAEDKSILFMGADNTLYYPTTGASIGAQRAYFKIGEGTALAPVRLTSFSIDFGEGETTGIQSIDNLTIDKLQFEADAWYMLDGRRLSGKPTRTGVYIYNGKKIVIK